MNRLCLLCCSLLFISTGHVWAKDAYEYLNKVRLQAGMSPFYSNEQLAMSAQNLPDGLNIPRVRARVSVSFG